MSLIRSSMIAGVTTGLLGIGAMTLGDKESFKEPYFWSATVSTAVVGGLAWAILHNEKVEEALDLDAEYDFQNQAITTVIADDEDEAWEDFGSAYSPLEDWEIVEVREGESSNFLTLAAEFAADRKARRRSRLSWTRGFEPAFTDADGDWDANAPNGYSQPEWWLTDDPDDDDFAHYHIDFGGKTGTEGYHIHLWKPEGRPRWNRKWTAMAKSPKSDEWKRFSDVNKGNLTPVLLGWYNEDIAEPEKIQTDGFMEYLISTGAIQAGPQLARQYQPAIERTTEDAKAKGIRRGVSFSRPGETQIYFLGGGLEPTLLLKVFDNENKIDWHTPLESVPEELMPFAQMCLFHLGTLSLQDLVSQRSINRFNKSPSTWVKSYPAWFQSVVRNGIFDCRMSLKQDYSPSGKYSSKGQLTTQINERNFVRWGNDYGDSRWNWEWKKLEKGMTFQVLEEREEEDGVINYYWHTPRPSTIRKMYDNIPQEIYDLNGYQKGRKIAEEIHYQCVQKYQPQKMKRFADSMVKQPNVFDTSKSAGGFGISPRSGKMMCRRFKKNDK